MNSLAQMQTRFKGNWTFVYFVLLNVLFAISRTVIFRFLAGNGTDLGIHLEYARKIASGEMPFRDFNAEYPPLTFAFTTAPLLFDYSLRSYFTVFRSYCCVIDCLIWLLLLLVNRGSALRPLVYIIASTCLGPIFYDRIDIVLGALLLASIVTLKKEYYKMFAIAVGLAIAFKLIPLVWVPTIAVFTAVRLRAKSLVIMALLITPIIVSFGIPVILGATHLRSLIEYHQHRGIQVESVLSSVEMLLMWGGHAGHIGYEFGSTNLHTAFEPFLISFSAVSILVIVFIGGPMLMWRHIHSIDSLILTLAWILISSVTLSKVLSPQYFIFVLPVLLVMPPSKTLSGEVGGSLLILFIYALTGWIYPWLYDDLSSLQTYAQGLLLTRNELLIILSCILFFRAFYYSSTTNRSESHSISCEPQPATLS